MPQVPMDPPLFMLALLSMTDAEYQMWRSSIAYAERLMGDLDYGEFSETCLMPFFPIGVCILSLSSLFSLYLAYLAYVACDDAQCGNHVRMWLVLPWVALLTLPICLGQSLLMVLMALLGSFLWDETQMSWVILSLWVYKQWVLFILVFLYPSSFLFSFFCTLRACLNNVFFSNLAHYDRAQGACLAH